MIDQIEPAKGFVILEKSEYTESTRPSGLVLFQTEENPNNGYGEVIAVSSEGVTQVSIGEKVLYLKDTGTDFKLMGRNLVTVKEEDILAVM